VHDKIVVDFDKCHLSRVLNLAKPADALGGTPDSTAVETRSTMR
jgi:hypothetical protein